MYHQCLIPHSCFCSFWLGKLCLYLVWRELLMLVFMQLLPAELFDLLPKILAAAVTGGVKSCGLLLSCRK